MYTNTNKFRVDGRYRLFTIPKRILNELEWKPGDLIGFWSPDKKVIHIEKICGNEELEKFKKNGGKYSINFYREIVKLGGASGTYGTKLLPEFLIEDFKPKNGQKVYFLPAKYTWYKKYYPQNLLNNIIFAAFDSKYLNKYNISKQESREEQELFYKNRIKEKSMEKYKGKNKEKNNYVGYNFGLFHGCLEYTDNNSDRAKRRASKFNKALSRDKILILKKNIKRFEGYLKKVESSKHTQKKKTLQDLGKMIKETKLIIEKLKKDPEKIFKEFIKEERGSSMQKNIKDKRNRRGRIERRHNKGFISST